MIASMSNSVALLFISFRPSICWDLWYTGIVCWYAGMLVYWYTGTGRLVDRYTGIPVDCILVYWHTGIILETLNSRTYSWYILEAIPHNEGAHKQRLTEDIISVSLIATTGNPSIDYFVSAAVLEAQNRTALSQEDEPYSEQVIVNKQTQNTKTQKKIYIHIYIYRPSSFPIIVFIYILDMHVYIHHSVSNYKKRFY